MGLGAPGRRRDPVPRRVRHLGGTEWGRWVGIISAGCNAILQMFFIPALPLLSVSLFAVDVLVIYGLVTYGGRRRAGT